VSVNFYENFAVIQNPDSFLLHSCIEYIYVGMFIKHRIEGTKSAMYFYRNDNIEVLKIIKSLKQTTHTCAWTL